METIPLLKQLSEAHGPPGSEGPIRAVIQEIWAPLVDDLKTGGLGSLISLRRGSGPEPRPRLMFAAHMDEIGLRITNIDKGFLRIASISGTDRRVLPGMEVVVHGRKEMVGIVAMRPPHVVPRDQRDKSVPWDELFIDLGLAEEEVKKWVRVGDSATFQQEMLELKGGLVAGKAMDNRASVAAVTLALAQLSRIDHSWDVVAVATVQEEMGLYGAVTSAYNVAPDLAVAVDVTFANQPGASDERTVDMGKGPTIGIGPNFHPQIVERLKKAAETREIPYHIEPTPGRSGTDAWAIQVSREGVPTALVSIPSRYMHQPIETVAVQDVERVGRLLAAFAAGLEVDYRPGWEDEA